VAASVRIDVVQGTLDEAALTVPAGVVVNRVDGATVGGWTLSDGRLLVRLLDPVPTSAAFVVLGDMAAARDGTIALPLVRMPAAERETGGVAVDIVGSGELALRAARGLDGADPADLGDIVSGRESPSMLAFRMRPLTGSEPRSLTVDVVRYTPQAVLVATVDQARYRILAAEDGRLLVEATYAVRNNQRSFIKLTLPAGARVWSATVAGRPTRPGAAEAGSLLLPLEKGRAGEEAPVFRVRVVYLQEEPAWPDKGRLRIPLPAVDLPVSTIGVRVHHSPRFRVELEPGSFREAPDPGLFAESARPAPAALAASSGSGVVFDALIERFRSEGGLRTVTGTLPVLVDFPELGPSLFVAAELSAEGTAPVLHVNVKRTR
jgi:hypothetical protein